MINETRWTPGPWARSRYHYPNRDIVRRLGNSDNDAFAGERHICSVSPREKGEQAANAHLIASAPDLYAALHTLIHDGKAYEWHPLFQPLIKDARAALAKARGETNQQEKP